MFLLDHPGTPNLKLILNLVYYGPVGLGLGPTESVGRNAWYAWYAGTLVSDKTPEIKSAKFTDEII